MPNTREPAVYLRSLGFALTAILWFAVAFFALPISFHLITRILQKVLGAWAIPIAVAVAAAQWIATIALIFLGLQSALRSGSILYRSHSLRKLDDLVATASPFALYLRPAVVERNAFLIFGYPHVIGDALSDHHAESTPHRRVLSQVGQFVPTLELLNVDQAESSGCRFRIYSNQEDWFSVFQRAARASCLIIVDLARDEGGQGLRDEIAWIHENGLDVKCMVLLGERGKLDNQLASARWQVCGNASTVALPQSLEEHLKDAAHTDEG